MRNITNTLEAKAQFCAVEGWPEGIEFSEQNPLRVLESRMEFVSLLNQLDNGTLIDSIAFSMQTLILFLDAEGDHFAVAIPWTTSDFRILKFFQESYK